MLTLKTHCVCVEQISLGKRPKYFEVSGYPCCILNNAHFFWNRSQKLKKFHDVTKSGDVSKQNGISRTMRIINTKLQNLLMLSTNEAIYVENTFSYRDYVCQVSKTTTYVCNRLNTSFTSNLNRKFWNKSTLIWVGFLGVRFYSLAPTRLLKLKNGYLHLNSHILHLVYTTSLTDLCFNKNFGKKKKFV